MSEDHIHDEHCDHGDHGDDEEGIDLIRLTLVGEQMHCALDPTVFEDEPGTWGTVLADLARNLSEAMRDDPAAQLELLTEIRDRFLEALESPAEE
ncbi:MAG: DUF5076 domain-containing protein [Gemmataceae bacterium]